MDKIPGVDSLEAALIEWQKRASRDLFLFARGLTIPSARGPVLFDDCMADFQRECFGLLGESLAALRDGAVPKRRRFWIERTKKAGKDSDLAICLLWLMAFARRPLKAQVCASNQEQARIVVNRAVELLHYNSWLNDHVEVVQNWLRSKSMPRKVWTHIEATGTAGAAHGETPDLLVLNELVHVDRWEVMEAHMNNADGVPNGVVIVSTNAGICGTRAESWRRTALASPERWSVLVWNRVAPWISPEDVEEARRRDPIGKEFERLWLGRWTSGTGNAVSDDAIDRCFTESGPSEPDETKCYVAGLDLGVSHDHSGVAVVEVDMSRQRLRLAWFQAWEPVPSADGERTEVDLPTVERACVDLHRRYGIVWFGYDPAAGGSYMAQRLRRFGLPMVEVNFNSPKVRTEIARTFIQVINAGKLACYDTSDGRLRRDFGKFDVEHRPPSDYRLRAASDEHGHADVGMALALCLPTAFRFLGNVGELHADAVVASVGNVELTEDELRDMPAELREILDARPDDGRWHAR